MSKKGNERDEKREKPTATQVIRAFEAGTKKRKRALPYTISQLYDAIRTCVDAGHTRQAERLMNAYVEWEVRLRDRFQYEEDTRRRAHKNLIVLAYLGDRHPEQWDYNLEGAYANRRRYCPVMNMVRDVFDRRGVDLRDLISGSDSSGV